MAYRLLKQQRRFVLHYFARSAEHAAFLPLLSRAPFSDHVKLHFGVARERLDAVLGDCLANAREGTHLYTCGPAPFMERVVAIGETRVVPEAIHLERFAAEPAGVSNNETATLDTFDVRFASSGATVRVDKDTTIVAALASIGIEVDTSCGEGVCGTCMVDVVSGTPEHRDHCLRKAERASGKVICCCISRAASPVLVLDVDARPARAVFRSSGNARVNKQGAALAALFSSACAYRSSSRIDDACRHSARTSTSIYGNSGNWLSTSCRCAGLSTSNTLIFA
jgi:vanillate O-demethylase ferredoxin subunit